MNRTSVKSSNLQSVGYDEETRILEVEFKNGDVYQYLNVPVSIFTGLLSATSKGSYFDTYVKKAGYSYRQV
jgi:hypothetical protein